MWPELMHGTWNGVLYGLSLILALAGLVGCVLPYAGHFLILAGCATWVIATGAPYPPWWIWLILTLMAIFGTFVDNLTTAFGARKFGGGRWAFWFSLLGLIIGTLMFFPLGFILGPFAGAFLAEWLVVRRPVREAAQAGLGATLGLLSGVACKILIALMMIALAISVP